MTDIRQPALGIQEAVASVEGYEFEPIKGYPMLQWKGKRPFRSTHFYPAQLREVHGPEVDGWRSKVYWGDNLQVMSHLLKEFRGQIDLVYIDPPYDSKADYKQRVQVKTSQLVEGDQSSFEQKQYSDIWTNDEYLQFMFERLVLIRELLSEAGSLYLHCDWHRAHLLRSILDEVFGNDRFVNEICWKRSANTSSIGRIWKRAHDTILMYSKSSDYAFNFQRKPLSAASLEIYSSEDEKGRYRLVPLLVSGRRNGVTGQPWRGIDPNKRGKNGMHWVTIPSKLERYDQAGLIVWSEKDGVPGLKYYLADNPGVVVSDFWDDISLITSNSTEHLGFPTQKPETLLERIIRASSNPGDIVFDCFMGSGTTQAVAMKLGRRFIGADINLGAVQITTRRLIQVGKELAGKAAAGGGQLGLGLGDAGMEGDEDEENEEAVATAAEPGVFYTGFEVYNVNHYDIFRNPVEARELLMQALEVVPLPAGSVYDGTKDGRMVKIMPVNRIATRGDLNDLIANFDYKAFERRYAEHPTAPVEKITLVCMGHEPDLAAALKKEIAPKVLDVEVYDVLRDGQHLEFKRDAEARVAVKDGWLEIAAFYPMNLLGKLSLQKESVEDWRELAESVMVDWNYDGAVLTPAVVDIPEKNGLVVGRYRVPEDAGTIRVKITDLLSEPWEGEVR